MPQAQAIALTLEDLSTLTLSPVQKQENRVTFRNLAAPATDEAENATLTHRIESPQQGQKDRIVVRVPEVVTVDGVDTVIGINSISIDVSFVKGAAKANKTRLRDAAAKLLEHADVIASVDEDAGMW